MQYTNELLAVEPIKLIGPLCFHLFDEATPDTARRFRHLISARQGRGYAGTNISRIIPGFIVHGGVLAPLIADSGRTVKFPGES